MEFPDKSLDRKLSFGCGAALGLFVSFLGALSAGSGFLESLAIALAVAVAFGALSVIFGDRFLELMVKWLSWQSSAGRASTRRGPPCLPARTA